MRPILATLLSGLLVLSAMPPQTQRAAQTPPPAAPKGGFKFATTTQLVVVDVTVKDKSGNPIKGLKPADFNTTDRKSTRLNSGHRCIPYAVFCLNKKRSRAGLADAWPRPCGDLRHRATAIRWSAGRVFFFYCSGAHRDLPSFPTRRPSD